MSGDHTVIFILLYTAGFLLNIVAAGTIYDEGDKKLGARIGLMSPLWPLTLIFGGYRLVKLLWEKAEFEIDLRKVEK